MRIRIIKDEAWPVYYMIHEHVSDSDIEITREEFDWIEKVKSEYYKAQEFLAKKLESATKIK